MTHPPTESKSGYLGGIHLVDSYDKLPYTKSVSQKSVLASLTVFGDTSLELASAAGNDENGAVSLRGTGDHVLDKVAMAWGVDNLCWRSIRS
jgi:hypothetical protein